MLGKASVIKTRNQVKDIPVHQERVFSFVNIISVLPYKNSEKESHKKYLGCHQCFTTNSPVISKTVKIQL